jgi:rubredoxin
MATPFDMYPRPYACPYCRSHNLVSAGAALYRCDDCGSQQAGEYPDGADPDTGWFQANRVQPHVQAEMVDMRSRLRDLCTFEPKDRTDLLERLNDIWRIQARFNLIKRGYTQHYHIISTTEKALDQAYNHMQVMKTQAV